MYSGKQIRGQVHTRFNPHKLLMKNGKRKTDIQMQSACEGDLWKIGASHQKRRAVQNIMHKGAVAESSFPMVKKVDTFRFPRKHVGEECVCLSSFEDKIDQSVEETESSLSSVGSSSSYESNNKLHSDKNHSNRPGVSSPFNDAQSSYDWPNVRKTEALSERDIAAKLHKLALSAYFQTMRAFYASGCLTWEREALLTDLRISLHISHDEHLSELTRLRPAQAVKGVEFMFECVAGLQASSEADEISSVAFQYK